MDFVHCSICFKVEIFFFGFFLHFGLAFGLEFFFLVNEAMSEHIRGILVEK